MRLLSHWLSLKPGSNYYYKNYLLHCEFRELRWKFSEIMAVKYVVSTTLELLQAYGSGFALWRKILIWKSYGSHFLIYSFQSALRSLPSLQKLSLSQCENITDDVFLLDRAVQLTRQSQHKVGRVTFWVGQVSVSPYADQTLSCVIIIFWATVIVQGRRKNIVVNLHILINDLTNELPAD